MIGQTFLDFCTQYPDQLILIFAIGLLGVGRFSLKITNAIVSLSLLSAIVLLIPGQSAQGVYIGFLSALVALDSIMWRNLGSQFCTEKKIFVLFWAIAGHLLIIQSNWLTFYLGLEITTIPFYALIALSSHPQSLEGTLKYFTINAFFSVLWLFALSLVWTGIHAFSYDSVLLTGLEGAFFIVITCLVIALKMGAFPCGYWAPDCYQVSQRSTIVWLSFIPKYLTIVICARLLDVFHLTDGVREVLLSAMALGTLWGHFGALFQKNIQRFLGYTAAAQIGLLFAPLFVHGSAGLTSSLVYLCVYTFSLLAFLYGLQRSFLESVHTIVRNQENYGLYSIAYFSGLLSLAGFPPFPGFFAKLDIFMTIIKGNNHMGLVVFLGLSNLLAIFYYMEWIFKTQRHFAVEES